MRLSGRVSPAVFLLVGIVLMWVLVTQLRLISALFLPAPEAVVLALKDMVLDQGFLRDVLVSLTRLLVGCTLAIVCAIPLGLALGLLPRVARTVEPFVISIRFIPIAGVIPLLVLWLGIGEEQKVFIIFLGIFFSLTIATMISVARTPKALIDYTKTLGANSWEIATRVVLPCIEPLLLEQVRLLLELAWSVLMIAEIVGATSGIGFVIIQSQRLLQTPRIFAALFVIALLGFLVDACMKRWIRFRCPWFKETSLYVSGE